MAQDWTPRPHDATFTNGRWVLPAHRPKPVSSEQKAYPAPNPVTTGVIGASILALPFLVWADIKAARRERSRRRLTSFLRR